MDAQTINIFSFNLNMQLLLLGQNVCEVNREHSRLAAASSVCDSTKHNGLVTLRYRVGNVVKALFIDPSTKGFTKKHFLAQYVRKDL